VPSIREATGWYDITAGKVRDRCKRYEDVTVTDLIGSKWDQSSHVVVQPPPPPPPPKTEPTDSVEPLAEEEAPVTQPVPSLDQKEGAVPQSPEQETPPVPLRRLGELERHRRQKNTARRDLRRALERIDELKHLVTTYEQYTQEPVQPIQPTVVHSGQRNAVAVALLSDVHAEERIVPTEVVRNEYSLEIAKRRVSRFFQGIVWLTKHVSHDTFNIPTLVLWLGGDLITGDIHDELLETAEVPPAVAMLSVRDWIVSGIHYVLENLPDISVTVPCSYGNHGRTTKETRHTTGYGHSWEWVMYQILGHDFKDEPRVTIHATRDEMQYVTVLDRTLAFHHGFNIKYRGGLGGVTVPAIKACHRWDKWRDCDIYHFGHFHQLFDLPQIVFNGSVVGPSPYGFAIGATPEPPKQSFYILDEKRGKTMSCPVWVHE
jgi:hypothetical protein